jgi:crotonobetainyl-CoA:carnitine CoA-transferase CaiB-like acyl-CoA transferase
LPPVRDGQGYFFTFGNSDKRTLVADLRTAAGKELFGNLLREADILVENLKVGSLARLGFSHEDIARINPKLVHCSITGFGADSLYSDRPAMDTTVQGMSGIMDLTRSDTGIPYKTGISIADIAGGQLGLVATLAGLASRERTGRGQHIDISMQAASVWLTQTAWNSEGPVAHQATLLRCADGYVAVDSRTTLKDKKQNDSLLDEASRKSRFEAVSLLSQNKVACASVLSVSEAARHPQTEARRLIVSGTSTANLEWPLLACPMRFSRTPATVRRAIGPAGADAAEVMEDWGLINEPTLQVDGGVA